MHSYSQKIISSFAASRNAVPEEPKTVDQMNEAGKRISEAITKVSNTKNEYDQARDILYPSRYFTKKFILDIYLRNFRLLHGQFWTPKFMIYFC